MVDPEDFQRDASVAKTQAYRDEATLSFYMVSDRTGPKASALLALTLGVFLGMGCANHPKSSHDLMSREVNIQLYDQYIFVEGTFPQYSS